MDETKMFWKSCDSKKRHLRYSSHVQAGTYAEDFSVSHSASSDGGSASMEESSPESGRTVSWKKREDSCPPRQIYEEEYGRKL